MSVIDPGAKITSEVLNKWQERSNKAPAFDRAGYRETLQKAREHPERERLVEMRRKWATMSEEEGSRRRLGER